jgi:hypothetical protein
MADSWRSIRDEGDFRGQEKVTRPTQETGVEDLSEELDPRADELDKLRAAIAEKLTLVPKLALSEILAPLRNRDDILFPAAILAIGDLLKQGTLDKDGYRAKWVSINDHIQVQELIVTSNVYCKT